MCVLLNETKKIYLKKIHITSINLSIYLIWSFLPIYLSIYVKRIQICFKKLDRQR